MAFATEATRRFTARLNSLLDKTITVRLTNGRAYTGKLVGFEHSSLSLVLESATDNENKNWPIVIIRGGVISEILVSETAIFDAKEFAEFLVRYGGIPLHQIKVYEDLNVVEVAKSVRVTKNGVEGAGPLAHRLNTLFREYLRRKGVRVE